MLMKIDYVRISKQEHHEALPIDVLKEAGCEQECVEKMTSTKVERKSLDEVLTSLREDTFLAWNLDRAGRSLTHLIALLKGLKACGIPFISLTELLDTSACSTAPSSLTPTSPHVPSRPSSIPGSPRVFRHNEARERLRWLCNTVPGCATILPPPHSSPVPPPPGPPCPRTVPHREPLLHE